MLEHREEENGPEGAGGDDGRRRAGPREIPFEEIPVWKAPPLLGEDFRVPVTADVGRQLRGEISQSAAQVEDPRPGRHVFERGRQTRRSDAHRETTVEGRAPRHAPGFTPSNVRSSAS